MPDPCQCFQIGGPFIAEDPACPIHGTDAQAEKARQEQAEARNDEAFQALTARLEALETKVARLQAKLSDLIDTLAS